MGGTTQTPFVWRVARQNWPAFIGLLVLSGCAARPTPSNDDIVRNFEIIAFHNEFGPAPKPWVRKWAKPIRVGIVGEDPDGTYTKLIRDHVDDLAQITGHDIALAGDEADVNLTVYLLKTADILDTLERNFGDRISKRLDRIHALLLESDCSGHFAHRADYEIYQAFAVIPLEVSGPMRKACVVEEIT